jgi:hypothetical protein
MQSEAQPHKVSSRTNIQIQIWLMPKPDKIQALLGVMPLKLSDTLVISMVTLVGIFF